ncbi:hypothetical protein [Bauldia litoralis]|uniref:hypothetical protein n=2 Tax=Bauldia litoralis TaxID=665467 RepID=UPI0032631D71
MRVWLALGLLLGLAGAAAGQEQSAEEQAIASKKPFLRISLEETSAIPGQALIYRIEILTPTFLPKPPIFPSFEVPDVMVRLPERASGPISESIERETWAGVGRSYRLTPMVPGRFTIPAGVIKVTYADPETSAPVVVNLRTEPLSFVAARPPGTEDLDPFIAAENIEIEQTVSDDPEALAPGDSIVREVTVRIDGVSPLFIPPLIPPVESNVIASYPAEPAIAETDDRGVLSGTRVDRVTYIAQAGGQVALPEISIRWFNLESGKVESGSVPGIALEISGPPPSAEPFDWTRLALLMLAGAVVLGLVSWGVYLLSPRIAAWRSRRHAEWLASESFAYRKAEAAIRGRRFNDATAAIALWRRRASGRGGRADAALDAAMARLGQSIYGVASGSGGVPGTEAWSAALAALKPSRRDRRSTHTEGGHPLPPLNPSAPAAG